MVDVPPVDRHVLAFSGDLPGGSSGRFDQARWQVAAASTTPGDPARADLGLASLHELAHALLNDSTSWGTMLATLAMPGPASGEQARRSVLSDLVDSCRTTHESFATHASVEHRQPSRVGRRLRPGDPPPARARSTNAGRPGSVQVFPAVWAPIFRL